MAENVERYLANTILNENGCLLWNGYKDKYGYGRIWGMDRTDLLHRFIFEEMNNIILPPNISVCHTCDNPSCINPKHLFSGTHEDNMKDKIRKGRGGNKHKGSISVSEEIFNDVCNKNNKIKDLVDKYKISKATIGRYRAKIK